MPVIMTRSYLEYYESPSKLGKRYLFEISKQDVSIGNIQKDVQLSRGTEIFILRYNLLFAQILYLP